MCEHYIPPCMNNEEHEFIRHTEPICKTEEEYKRFMGIMCSPDIWGNDGGRAFGEYVDDNFLKTMMDDCTVDGETVVKTVRKFLSKCMETTHRVYNDDYDSDTAKSKVTKDFAYLTAWVAIMMRKAGISRYEFKEAVTDATHKIICGKR